MDFHTSENLSYGWIKLCRSLIDWEYFTKPKHLQLFMFCLLRANHKEGSVNGVEIPAGSFVTSYKSMSNITKLTVRELRTRFKHFQKTGEISVKTTSEFSIVTIVKWKVYQEGIQKMTNERHSKDNQTSTNNNDNNDNNSPLVGGDYIKEDFLFDWNTIREHYDKVESTVLKLEEYEETLFNKAKRNYSKKDIQTAMEGMFQQKNQMKCNRIKPKHFLENIDTYKDCFVNKIQIFKK